MEETELFPGVKKQEKHLLSRVAESAIIRNFTYNNQLKLEKGRVK